MPTEVIKTKERPIIFSGPMVRAILDGRKTVTRRTIKPQPTQPLAGHVICSTDASQSGKWRFAENDHNSGEYFRCPYGLPGDRMWVRETHSFSTESIPLVGQCVRNWEYVKRIWFQADNNRPTWAETKWRPSIFMPRHASRITLDVVSVRVERLQEITESDSHLEGFQQTNTILARSDFIRHWKILNGVDSWYVNPWVWRIEFKRVQQ